MFLTECPRDAMQGWEKMIPTSQKIDYLNTLMNVGFDVLDCGSFVSPRAIPQMADTADVLAEIDTSSGTKLSVIVANIRGSERAVKNEKVDILGFPFSISEIFQQRNTNKSQEKAFSQIQRILEMCQAGGKELNVYFSMAFGNPYDEEWNFEKVDFWAKKFQDIGVKNILLSDTTGVATLENIDLLFRTLPKKYPEISFGAHFHNRYEDSFSKLKSAYDAGCRRFDAAIKGIGGCPMAKDKLVGNMPTEQLVNFLAVEKIEHQLHLLHFESAFNEAKKVFDF